MNNVKLELRDAVAILTVDRPQALNALNTETLNELYACLKEIEEKRTIRAVILTGGGEKAFIAGADIAEMYQADAADGREFSALGYRVTERLENMRAVTIAAINGYALGGGCEMSLACDIRIASENAVFAQPETGLGIVPGFGGTQRLSRLIGKGRAKELIFTCDRIDAQEAYRIGLVNHVVPKEELMPYCEAMANRVARNAPLAVEVAKQAINVGLDVDLNSGIQLEENLLGLLFATQDKKEGMGAFLEKRKEKHFTGR